MIGFLLSTLTACSTLPSLTQGQRQQRIKQNRQALTNLRAWHINGALAIRTATDGISLFADWQQQDPKHYQIQLTGPAGSGSATLIATPMEITLTTSKGEQHRAKHAETLLHNILGWNLPVDNLYYWIRGLAVPQQSAKRLYDQAGRIQSIQQADWHIEYKRFQSLQDLPLPSKLILSNQQRQLTLKILINRWRSPVPLG